MAWDLGSGLGLFCLLGGGDGELRLLCLGDGSLLEKPHLSCSILGGGLYLRLGGEPKDLLLPPLFGEPLLSK